MSENRNFVYFRLDFNSVIMSQKETNLNNKNIIVGLGRASNTLSLIV